MYTLSYLTPTTLGKRWHSVPRLHFTAFSGRSPRIPYARVRNLNPSVLVKS